MIKKRVILFVVILVGLSPLFAAGVFQDSLPFFDLYKGTQLIVDDFNGDGVPDCAVSLSNTNPGMAVAYGIPSGVLTSPIKIELDNFSPSSFTSGDFNNDGIADLAASINSDVVILSKTDQGSFSQQWIYIGFNAKRMQTGDFNGDGNEDIALLETWTQRIHILAGLGNNDFSEVQFPATMYTEKISAFTTCDLNNDGKWDIVTISEVNDSEFLSVYLGHSSSFEKSYTTSTPIGLGAHIIRTGNLNGDLIADLVVFDANPGTETFFYTFIGTSDGSFQPPQAAEMGNGFFTLGDTNNDKLSDIVLTSETGTAVYLSRGDGTFTPQVFQTPFITNDFFYSFKQKNALGDINGDGNLDFFCLWGQGCFVIPGNGKGEFPTGKDIIDIRLDLNAELITEGEFNGDGLPDIACISQAPESANLKLFFGTETGGSFLQAGPEQTIPTWVDSIKAVDADNNGLDDLIVSHLKDPSGYFESQSFQLINRGGQFSDAQPLEVSGHIFTTGDFNNDTFQDLVVLSNYFTTEIAIGDGTGNFNIPGDGQATESSLIFMRTAKSCDWNNDGNIDLLGAANFDLLVYKGDGKGKLTELKPQKINTAITMIATEDLNGDKYPDVVGLTGKGILILQNKGEGHFEKVNFLSLDSQAFDLTVSDYTGDGKQDIFLNEFFLDDATAGLLFQGKSNFSFEVPERIFFPFFSSPMISFDLNNDKSTDLALSGRNQLALFRSRGSGSEPNVSLSFDELVENPVLFDNQNTINIPIRVKSSEPIYSLSFAVRHYNSNILTLSAINSTISSSERSNFYYEANVDILSDNTKAGYYKAVFVPPQPLEVPPEGQIIANVTFTILHTGNSVIEFTGDLFKHPAEAVTEQGRTTLKTSSITVTVQSTQALFLRGDNNADGSIDISDAISIIQFLFSGFDQAESCLDAIDANDDGSLNIADPIRILSYLFTFGPDLPPPFPDCGSDPSEDMLGCDLYSPCNKEKN